MADSIADLLADPVRRRELGAAGRQLVLKTGSLQAMVSGYQRLATQLYDRAAYRPQGDVRPASQSRSLLGLFGQRFGVTPLRKQAGGK